MENTEIIKKITDIVDKNHVTMHMFLTLMTENISESELANFIAKLDEKFSK